MTLSKLQAENMIGASLNKISQLQSQMPIDFPTREIAVKEIQAHTEAGRLAFEIVQFETWREKNV